MTNFDLWILLSLFLCAFSIGVTVYFLFKTEKKIVQDTEALVFLNLMHDYMKEARVKGQIFISFKATPFGKISISRLPDVDFQLFTQSLERKSSNDSTSNPS